MSFYYNLIIRNISHPSCRCIQCTHDVHRRHIKWLLPTPLLHTEHGHLPELHTDPVSPLFSHIYPKSLNLHSFFPFLKFLNQLFHSAISTRSSSNIMNNKQVRTDPQRTPTFTTYSSLSVPLINMTCICVHHLHKP